MKTRFPTLILAVNLLLLCVLAQAQTPAFNPKNMMLALKDTVYNTAVDPEVGAQRLRELQDSYKNLAGWEQRKKCVTEGILKGLGLNLSAQRTPLNSMIHSRKTFGSYTVENAAFECIPGLWVCGNLYRPLNKKGPFPGVLLAQGHSAQMPLSASARFSANEQEISALLATMGTVVFAYDMFAYGESSYHAGTKAHRTSLTQTIQTWSSIRGVDFLCSLPDIDPKRIAMTGYSGGGTQTFLAAALDERIAVSVPATQVSCFFPGGCPCESGQNIHKQCTPASNNAEIAALTAPRPQLVISDGKDWTRTVDKVEYPFIKSIYAFYGKEGLVENVHLADEGHDYGPSKQVAMFRFLARQFGLDVNLILDSSGQIKPGLVTLVPAEQLAVFPAGKLPDRALTSMEAIYKAFAAQK